MINDAVKLMCFGENTSELGWLQALIEKLWGEACRKALDCKIKIASLHLICPCAGN